MDGLLLSYEAIKKWWINGGEHKTLFTFLFDFFLHLQNIFSVTSHSPILTKKLSHHPRFFFSHFSAKYKTPHSDHFGFHTSQFWPSYSLARSFLTSSNSTSPWTIPIVRITVGEHPRPLIHPRLEIEPLFRSSRKVIEHPCFHSQRPRSTLRQNVDYLVKSFDWCCRHRHRSLFGACKGWLWILLLWAL